MKMIIGSIADGSIAPGSTEYHEMLHLVEKSATDTFTLLNNLLDWTRMQMGVIKLKPKNLALQPLMNDCTQFLYSSIQSKRINIENSIDEQTMAFFDEMSMHTVFRNILSNAVKFTPETGKITLTDSSTEDSVSIAIHDTGVGIPAGVIDMILNRKESYTSPGTRNETGSGLGLQLVRELVHQNNGTIQVESEENKGTLFTIILPKAGFQTPTKQT